MFNKVVSKQDLDFLKSHNVSAKQAEFLYDTLIKSNKNVELKAACNLENGIVRQDHVDWPKINHKAQTLLESQNKKIHHFIPASGAATRMFKDLHAFSSNSALLNSKIEYFFTTLQSYPFYQNLESCIKKNNQNLQNLINEKKYQKILNYLFSSKHMDYLNKPKALIPFFKEDNLLTPTEAHLILNETLKESFKGAHTAHFTVSNETIAQEMHQTYKKLSNKCSFKKNIHFEYSFQSNDTQTICLDKNQNIVRNPNNDLYLRPGGHGALLDNLNNLDAHYAFIQNIDNICSPKKQDILLKTKKNIFSLLLYLEEAIFNFQKQTNTLNEIQKNSFFQLYKRFFFIDLHQYKSKDVLDILNAPLRVACVVKNQGKAGGGPFFARYTKSEKNASQTQITYKNQIIEQAEVDTEQTDQNTILQQSTHFNPVNMVCALYNHKKEKFNLLDYRDDNGFFISQKTYQNQDIKIIEYPGLWNGSMAKWQTCFIEAPIETFTPVKTVFDLAQ